MKKWILWLVTAVATGVALFFLFTKHSYDAETAVLKDLPKDLGIATEAYKSRVAQELKKLQDAKAAEIAAKFAKAFGG
jgi:uncharacterized protein involved in exopolysaccharide biosynthesis